MSPDRYIEALHAEIGKTKFFDYQPSSETSRLIEMYSDGSVLDPRKKVSSWDVVLGGPRKDTPTLRLHNDGEILVLMALTSQGTWQGRDRRGGGRCLIVPQPKDGLTRWDIIANPYKYFSEFKPDDDEAEFRYQESLPVQIDWAPHEWDIRKLIKHPERYARSDTAVCLLANDRPDYFKQVVQTLAKNPEIKAGMPVFAFLDLPLEQEFLNCQRVQTEILNELIPNAVVIWRKVNFGCGRNLIDARKQLFDHLGFEYVFMFEDDMIVSPDYMDTCIRLMRWCQRFYDNVGAVQAWNPCRHSTDWKLKASNLVRPTFENLWGYLMSKRAWDAIKAQMYTYTNLFLGGDYRLRPHKSIAHWFRLKTNRKQQRVGSTQFPLDVEFATNRQLYIDGPPTGQDAATALLLDCAGFVRVTTVVNRGMNIGKVGLHMTPTRWMQQGMDEIALDAVPTPDTFEVQGQVETPKDAESPVEGFEYIRRT
jgi:hypothetical protein